MQTYERNHVWQPVFRSDAEDKNKVMYIVHNTSSKTVMLSDLRAEIKPMAILDLEKVAHREDIERSRDLKHALKTNKLQLGRHSVVRTVHIHDNTQPKDQGIDESRLASLIRQVVSEEMGKERQTNQVSQQNSNVDDMKKVHDSVNELLMQIRDRINEPQSSPKAEADETHLDPEKIAELSQRSVQQISSGIETGGSQKKKKVQIINDNLKNLADEL